MKKALATITAVALTTGAAFAEKSLEQRVAELEKQLAAQGAADTGKGSVLDDMSLASWAEKTSIGGYGELHYNNFENADDEIDFHRFVLFVNHNFNDRIRLVSELEVEHALAGDGKPGEVELEQAFIEMDFANDLQFRAGLFLIPVGHLNEHHEPPTFFGVERNSVEKNIIPTTWWEGGLGMTKKFENGFIIDGALTSGLNIPTSGSSTGKIRSGRGKVAEAIADSWAFTGRVTYVGQPGLKVSAFAQFNSDPVQDDAGSHHGSLYGATVDYQNGGFGFRALYAKWDLAGDIPTEAKDQSGWYVEPSYTWTLANNDKVGVFARYEDMEYYSGGLKNDKVTTVGVNYWPHENVVFKADIQDIESNGSDSKQWNLGVGFQF